MNITGIITGSGTAYAVYSDDEMPFIGFGRSADDAKADFEASIEEAKPYHQSELENVTITYKHAHHG